MKRSQARTSGKAFIERLSPIIFPIFTYLESGTQDAYAFQDGKRSGKAINNHLHCGIVRDHVCLRLDELRLAGSVRFGRIEVANSGIRVYFDGIMLKVLRPGIDEDGGTVVPEPKSDQQILFYNGNYYTGHDDNVVIQNLVMLWQSNHITRSVSAWLACPLGDEQLFCEEIPHPATQIAATPRPVVREDDSDLYQRRESEEPLTKTGEEEGEDE